MPNFDFNKRFITKVEKKQAPYKKMLFTKKPYRI